MSDKSIYDEALNSFNEIYTDEVKRVAIGNIYYNSRKTKVENALEQAQKQEILLGLYKELSNYVSEQIYAHELDKITRLKILIEELENDK